MIILIAGSSHTGKTYLSQKLMEKYGYPYVSIDHIKMGLIRSGYVDFTAEEDEKIIKYLWPIIREMVKTAIENNQNMIIEGCYIPYDWKNSFDVDYLKDIKYLCLVMSPEYIKKHFEDIRAFASVIEDRGEDEDCTMENVIKDNAECYEMCKKYGCEYVLIDKVYDIEKIMYNVFEK